MKTYLKAVVFFGTFIAASCIRAEEDRDWFSFDRARISTLPDQITYRLSPRDGTATIAYVKPAWDERNQEIVYLCVNFRALIETAHGEWAELPVSEEEAINAPGLYTLIYRNNSVGTPRLVIPGKVLRQRLRAYIEKNKGEIDLSRPAKIVVVLREYKNEATAGFVDVGEVKADYILARIRPSGEFAMVGYSADSITGTSSPPVMLKH